MRYDPYGHKSVHCDLIVALTEQTEPNYWISPSPIAHCSWLSYSSLQFSRSPHAHKSADPRQINAVAAAVAVAAAGMAIR